MLRTAFGPAIARFLEDPAIIEVMLNPDGRLWIDRLSGGLAETTERLSAPDGERIVRLVAHHVGAEVHAGSPREPQRQHDGRLIEQCVRRQERTGVRLSPPGLPTAGQSITDHLG